MGKKLIIVAALVIALILIIAVVKNRLSQEALSKVSVTHAATQQPPTDAAPAEQPAVPVAVETPKPTVSATVISIDTKGKMLVQVDSGLVCEFDLFGISAETVKGYYPLTPGREITLHEVSRLGQDEPVYEVVPKGGG